MRLTWIGVFTFVLALTTMTGTAHAQYGSFRQPVYDDTLLQRGRKEIGLNVAGVYSANSAQSSDGASVSQKTLYLNPGLYFGYMVHNRIQVRVLASYLGVMTGTDDATVQNSHSFLGGVQALYHHPLPMGFALYGGLGLVAAAGGTWRMVDSGAKVSNRTYAGGGQLLAGLLIQPGRNLTMRAGLRFDALFGVERPNDPTFMFPDQSTQNYQALLEAAISFRL